MKLSNVEMLPGVVVVDKDPDLLGRVKASCPTLFDAETMPLETLPWIYPLTMGHYQTYTKPRNGMKIWILNNTENYEEYWFIPMFEKTKDVNDVIAEDKEVDILMSRNMGAGTSTIYHTQDQGFVTKIGDNKQQIYPDGKITLDNVAGKNITLDKDSVSLGSAGSQQYTAARAEEVISAFNQIKTTLILLLNGLKTDKCGASEAALRKGVTEIDKKTINIKSTSVKID